MSKEAWDDAWMNVSKTPPESVADLQESWICLSPAQAVSRSSSLSLLEGVDNPYEYENMGTTIDGSWGAEEDAVVELQAVSAEGFLETSLESSLELQFCSPVEDQTLELRSVGCTSGMSTDILAGLEEQVAAHSEKAPNSTQESTGEEGGEADTCSFAKRAAGHVCEAIDKWARRCLVILEQHMPSGQHSSLLLAWLYKHPSYADLVTVAACVTCSVTSVALVGLLYRNERLARQVQMKDRELATVLTKLINLQSLLQRAGHTGRLPIIRYTCGVSVCTEAMV